MIVRDTVSRAFARRRGAERLVWRIVTAVAFAVAGALILQQPDRAADAAPSAPPAALVGSGALR